MGAVVVPGGSLVAEEAASGMVVEEHSRENSLTGRGGG